MDLIPKIIHYCWFGKKPMPELSNRCLESWKRYLPNYKIIIWNEDSFDENSTLFTKQAYDLGKYAFVSDYVRLYALYHYGGIYMDTDVEVLKNLDKFLIFPAFSGFENPDFIPTGIIGAIPSHPWIGRFLEHYKDKAFQREDGTMDMTANVRFMTKISQQEFGFERGNAFQKLKDDVYIFPNDFFCPKIWETKEIVLTVNTHTIHHFAAS